MGVWVHTIFYKYFLIVIVKTKKTTIYEIAKKMHLAQYQPLPMPSHISRTQILLQLLFYNR